MDYLITDSEQSGRVVATIVNVLAPVRLTGVEVTSGSAAVTFAVPAGKVIWPGMLVVGKGIPVGTTLLSVESDTAGTLSAPATADGTGLLAVAYGFDPTLRVQEVNIEHYRDLFSASTNQVVTSGGANAGALNMPGAGMYLAAPGLAVLSGPNLLAGPGVQVSGSLTGAVSDDLSHTPPREQVRKVAYVHFVCEDGTVVPQPMMPGYHIAQEVAG